MNSLMFNLMLSTIFWQSPLWWPCWHSTWIPRSWVHCCVWISWCWVWLFYLLQCTSWWCCSRWTVCVPWWCCSTCSNCIFDDELVDALNEFLNVDVAEAHLAQLFDDDFVVDRCAEPLVLDAGRSSPDLNCWSRTLCCFVYKLSLWNCFRCTSSSSCPFLMIKLCIC